MKNTAWTTLAVLSVLGLAACGPKEERKANNAINDSQAALSNAANATGNLLENAGMAMTPTPTGQEFADKAAKSDAFEIEAAKLAATNSQSPQVRAFAKMMISGHTESTAKIKAAAKEASPAITPDAALTNDQKEDLGKLKVLKGTDFDKAYIDGQVDAHKDALDLMKKYAADGTVASLKTTAGEIAPVVERHLTSAKALAKD
ncbi:MAG TPA: DUF4142 domain-containing protein [Sphingobium sp.]|uniref:DUF4142 domain-containing protein n=1 Tax=Sphingobium sp. TaxID=1912891 RepID=UPI002ED3508A